MLVLYFWKPNNCTLFTELYSRNSINSHFQFELSYGFDRHFLWIEMYIRSTLYIRCNIMQYGIIKLLRCFISQEYLHCAIIPYSIFNVEHFWYGLHDKQLLFPKADGLSRSTYRFGQALVRYIEIQYIPFTRKWQTMEGTLNCQFIYSMKAKSEQCIAL